MFNNLYTKRPTGHLFQEKLRTEYFFLYLVHITHLYLTDSNDTWVRKSCFSDIDGLRKSDAKLCYPIIQKAFLNGGSVASRVRIWIHWGMNQGLEVKSKCFLISFSSQLAKGKVGFQDSEQKKNRPKVFALTMKVNRTTGLRQKRRKTSVEHPVEEHGLWTLGLILNRVRFKLLLCVVIS